MKSGARLREDLRVQGPLGGRGETDSFLASGEGKSRKPRWVLKWLPAPGAEPLSSFLRPDLLELASMVHPSLALPSSFGRDRASGRAFLLRPYVEGTDLLSALRGTSPGKMLPWMVAAAEALGLLHRAGFLHRNLKPSNLIVPRKALFTRRPRGALIVLSDPAWWPEGAEPALGEEGIAHEILQGDPASRASDLYALGVVFHRMLAGRRIRSGPAGYPVPPSEVNARVPADLDRVVLKLSSPDPSRRYHDAEELIEDLERLASPRTTVRAPPPDMLIGREDELARARSLLEHPSRPRAIAITGEAGMGKSAFLRRLTLEAQVLGYETAVARCYPGKAAPLRTLAVRAIPAGAAGRPIRSRLKKLLVSAGAIESSGWSDAAGRRAFIRGLLDMIADASALRPTVLVLDEVHLADPMTIEFLQELLRDLGSATAGDPAPGRRCPPSLIFSFRSESPFLQALRPLIDALGKASDRTATIELPSLSSRAMGEWIDRAAGSGAAGARGLVAGLGGHPFLVREALRMWHGPEIAGAPRVPLDLGQAHVTYLASLPDGGRGALEALSVLARPAEPDLIASLARIPRTRWGSVLERLLKDRTLEREEGLVFFQHGSFQDWILETMDPATTRRLHERIAFALAKRPGSTVEELAHHWLHSGAGRERLAAYLAAARKLSRAHEGRRAQRFYDAALEILPRRGTRWRAVAEEAAGACARAGNHRRGIEILEMALGGARSPQEVGRLHGRIGVFRHRAGEIAEATFHLEKGLKLLEGVAGKASAREQVRIQSELAEILSNKGLYAEAEAMCRTALGSLRDSRGPRGDLEVRRDAMVLHETLAHLHLRRFHFREAEELFETSLEIGKEVGAVPERTLILNNLGTLHVQQNRFQKAIDCYEEAERLSAGIGDDQGLAIVLSNLAVLHARVGDPERADAAIARATYHESRSDSARSRFLRLHSEGIVDLVFGRHGSAIDAFRAAILLGEDLKDIHMTAFELVYLAECHVHRGEVRAAREALDRAEAVRPAPPGPIRAMAAARRAAIAAVRGERHEAGEACAAALRGLEGKIAYVDAWNRVFVGCALRLLARVDEARQEVERAREFFAGVKVPAGEVHADLELALLDMETGALDAARTRLDAIEARHAPGEGALVNPALCARLLAYRARLALDAAEPDMEAAESLLIEAESHLIGRRLKDLEALVTDLKGRLRDQRAASGRDPRTGLEPSTRSGGAPLIVGRSAAIRGMSAWIRQVAETALPVLITGETGTGKELVARAIHAESARRDGPLVSINCAALPEALLEAQLFGWSRGAFSGAEEDRGGLLRSAQGGTFLFDGIGEMSLALQAKLLRVLDTGRVRPVGAAEEVPVDVRFLFSSHRGLRALVDEERFRRDLFFRLGPFEIHVPPLRDRLADLPLLVEHFRGVAGLAEPAGFEEDALKALASHSWPGNVRELENVVTRLVLTSGDRITAKDVRLALGKKPPEGQFSPGLLRSAPLEALLAQLEKEHLVQLHADCAGDLETVAARLGITVRALYGRFRRLGVQPGALRPHQG